MTINPGHGADCEQADSSIQASILGKPVHIHADAKGFLKAYKGAPDECPDFRKARAYLELHQPQRRSM